MCQKARNWVRACRVFRAREDPRGLVMIWVDRKEMVTGAGSWRLEISRAGFQKLWTDWWGGASHVVRRSPALSTQSPPLRGRSTYHVPKCSQTQTGFFTTEVYILLTDTRRYTEAKLRGSQTQLTALVLLLSCPVWFLGKGAVLPLQGSCRPQIHSALFSLFAFSRRSRNPLWVSFE